MDNAKSFISIQRLNADQSIFKCAFDQIEIMEVNNSKAITSYLVIHRNTTYHEILIRISYYNLDIL